MFSPMSVSRHLFAAVLCIAQLGSSACNPQDFLGDFVDLPFGTPTGEVAGLDSDGLGPLMTTLYTRYTRYVALRDVIPFESLLSDACVVSTTTTNTGTQFQIDIPCAFPGVGSSGAAFVAQRTIASAPRVTEISIDYQDVMVGEISVDGTEIIHETDGAEGTSQRQVNMVQGGITLSYEFRLGLVNGNQVVLDYVLKFAGEDLLARLTDPSSPGAAATVLLTGTDETLSCELRNVPWMADEPARGLCDNGESFGLPETGATVSP